MYKEMAESDALQRLQQTITELREKNAEQDRIISQLPGYVYWKNREGVYLGGNDNQAHSLGFKKKGDVLGKTDSELPWAGDSWKVFVENDLTVMKTGQPIVAEEEAYLNGKLVTTISHKAPLKDKANNIVGILGVSIDITQHKELEKKLVKEKEEEEEKSKRANLIQTEFVRNMEHDIRTPFSGIWGMAEYLWEIEKDTVKKKHLGDITQCAKELLEYCNGILDFSKIESGMLTVINKKLTLENLVNSVIKIEQPIATHKKLQLTLSYDKDIPSVLIGDRYRLDRILINLMSNAIKFTEEGLVALKVTLIKQTTESALVRFVIEDTGIGIPVDKQEYIFEKFSRLSLSNKGLYKGIGLGLRITKQFMHEMEGEIDIMSEVGKGTQFICTIPFSLPLTNDFVQE